MTKAQKMSQGIVIEAAGYVEKSTGRGKYKAAVKIPRHSPITKSGWSTSTSEVNENRMELMAVVEGLTALRELANVEGLKIGIKTPGDQGYVRRTVERGYPEYWACIQWKDVSAENRELWERFLELTQDLELVFMELENEIYPGPNQNVPDEEPTQDFKQGYQKGYREGYEHGYRMARTDMANALNGLHPPFVAFTEDPPRAPGAELTEDLTF